MSVTQRPFEKPTGQGFYETMMEITGSPGIEDELSLGDTGLATDGPAARLRTSLLKWKVQEFDRMG